MAARFRSASVRGRRDVDMNTRAALSGISGSELAGTRRMQPKYSHPLQTGGACAWVRAASPRPNPRARQQQIDFWTNVLRNERPGVKEASTSARSRVGCPTLRTLTRARSLLPHRRMSNVSWRTCAPALDTRTYRFRQVRRSPRSAVGKVCAAVAGERLRAFHRGTLAVDRVQAPAKRLVTCRRHIRLGSWRVPRYFPGSDRRDQPTLLCSHRRRSPRMIRSAACAATVPRR